MKKREKMLLLLLPLATKQWNLQGPPSMEPFKGHQAMEPSKGHQTLEPSIGHQVEIFFHLFPSPFL